MSHRPCGVYHESYRQDHAWWQTKFVRGKMILLAVSVCVLMPLWADSYSLGVANMVGYTVLGALGVQLLIGYCGQVTLGHAAFLAVGAYTSTLLILQVPWPQFLIDHGLAYPLSILVAAVAAGLWSVFFGLPCVKVKGFYLILTTMAAQFIKIGPWVIDNERKVYFLMVALVALMTVGLANLLRSRVGRAWIAIRDNDIAAQTMGINIVRYKLLAFFVAGFIGGVAGAFWISNLAAVSPEHFPWSWSLWLVGVILIGGAGSIQGTFFGSLFMVLVMEMLTFGVMSVADLFPQLLMKLNFIKEAAFGLAICGFLIYEPKGLAYRWRQIRSYFNLWPFSY
jgi:branched-chain amino acid transport system permease protein